MKKDFGVNITLMLQFELTHTISNRWLKEHCWKEF
jgi:hypothetical protein